MATRINDKDARLQKEFIDHQKAFKDKQAHLERIKSLETQVAYQKAHIEKLHGDVQSALDEPRSRVWVQLYSAALTGGQSNPSGKADTGLEEFDKMFAAAFKGGKK